MSFCIKNKDIAKTFYNTLIYILPCGTCRTNFSRHLKNHPITKNIPIWLFEIHNMINQSTGSMIANESELELSKLNCGTHFDDIFFVENIIKTHPGMHKVSDEYIQALETFLKIWATHSSVKEIPKKLHSRRYLFAWLRRVADTYLMLSKKPAI